MSIKKATSPRSKTSKKSRTNTNNIRRISYFEQRRIEDDHVKKQAEQAECEAKERRKVPPLHPRDALQFILHSPQYQRDIDAHLILFASPATDFVAPPRAYKHFRELWPEIQTPIQPEVVKDFEDGDLPKWIATPSVQVVSRKGNSGGERIIAGDVKFLASDVHKGRFITLQIDIGERWDAGLDIKIGGIVKAAQNHFGISNLEPLPKDFWRIVDAAKILKTRSAVKIAEHLWPERKKATKKGSSPERVEAEAKWKNIQANVGNILRRNKICAKSLGLLDDLPRKS